MGNELKSSPRGPSRSARLRIRLIAGMVVLTMTPVVAADQFTRVYANSSKPTLTEWGRRYENGEGVTADSNRAIKLYCKAANLGHADAQYYLGRIYSQGRGATRDDALAAAWFKRAASQNHPQARNLLRLLAVKPKPNTACPTSERPPVVVSRGARPRPAPEHVSKLVQNLAPEFHLDPDLVLALIQVESNFNPDAQSPKSAQGLMQLIPATAERFGVKNVWDPEQNLRGGMAYLRWLLDYFGGDMRLALAGYNAGEGAVDKYRGVPPYQETQNYVRQVVGILDR